MSIINRFLRFLNKGKLYKEFYKGTPEAERLSVALCKIPGVEKAEVCGSKYNPLLAFPDFDKSNWQALFLIGRAIDRRYGGVGFRLECIVSDLPEAPIYYCLSTDTDDLRGPPLSGQAALDAASKIADNLEYLLSPGGAHIRRHFGLGF